ncbi:MAG: dTDP-4-dehydrorhamnose reductase [Deltaproteobacteria bacterium]|nr:dTDP-4-dehydrorhamnose reductase [Deltaproteobacteria bacterium]
MKILVLGYKGMLGSDLMLRLASAHDVTGKDVDDFDITVEDDCRRVVDECSPDVVINAAAYTNVDGCEAERDRCFLVNATGVKNIALACRGRGTLIVHFSTDYVFDGQKPAPYTEADEPAPLNVYGASKREGERFLQALSDRWLLIRTAWLYGRSGKNFVKTILEKGAELKTLDVVDDQIGSPTYSWDLSAGVKLLVEGRHEGLFHLTNRGRCSWYEFACRILQYAGMNDVTVRPIRTGDLARPAMRPAWSVLSSRKFSEATGKTMRFWQIALQEYLEKTYSRK